MKLVFLWVEDNSLFVESIFLLMFYLLWSETFSLPWWKRLHFDGKPVIHYVNSGFAFSLIQEKLIWNRENFVLGVQWWQCWRVKNFYNNKQSVPLGEDLKIFLRLNRKSFLWKFIQAYSKQWFLVEFTYLQLKVDFSLNI